MPIRVSSFTITVGAPQDLEVAQDEDRQFNLTFQNGTSPIDFSGAQAILLSVRSRSTGVLLFSREHSGFVGAASAGTPYFQILAADTNGKTAGPYDLDVTWTDASGYREQLLIASTFRILQGVGNSSDPVTTPAAVPVVYGLNWTGDWTGKSGGYQVNDAVDAYDGSLGATAVSTFRALSPGVTGYPVTGASQVVASGWKYVGQHGGIGGPAGAHATATLTTAYSETTAVYSSIKSLSITTTGGDLWVNVNGMALVQTNFPSSNPAQGHVQLKLNGTVKLQTELWSVPVSASSTTGGNSSFSLSKLFTGLAAGTYTIAVEGKFTDGADGTGGSIGIDGTQAGGPAGYLEIQAVELK